MSKTADTTVAATQSETQTASAPTAASPVADAPTGQSDSRDDSVHDTVVLTPAPPTQSAPFTATPSAAGKDSEHSGGPEPGFEGLRKSIWLKAQEASDKIKEQEAANLAAQSSGSNKPDDDHTPA